MRFPIADITSAVILDVTIIIELFFIFWLKPRYVLTIRENSPTCHLV